MVELELLKKAATKIWDICKESSEIGNAVMDLLGNDAYQRVMMYKKKDIPKTKPEKLYLCDPNKNTECKKSDCGHLGTGKCFCTTKKEFMADGFIVDRPKTNQDILAELVRNAAPEDIAEAIMQDTITPIINCGNCPAREYCESRMKYDEEDEPIPDPDGTLVTCEKVMNEWLKEEIK